MKRTEIEPPKCKKCHKLFIKFDSLFCPYCGTACLNNSIIDNSTTGSFDPSNRLQKPWREPPPSIPLPPLKHVSHTNMEPWRPIMKNTLRKRRMCKLAPKRQESRVASNPTVHESPVANSYSQNISTAVSIRKEDTLTFVDQDVSETQEMTSRISPLAAYEADWLSRGYLMQLDRPSLMVSLFEIRERSEVLCWLRVGVLLGGKDSLGTESEDDTSIKSAESSNSDSYVIGVESYPRPALNLQFNRFFALDLVGNALGKCLKKSSKDWVDLNTVDPQEYYVTEYLQRLLIDIAHRAKLSTYMNWDLTDQWILVNFSGSGAHLSELTPKSISNSNSVLTSTWFQFNDSSPFTVFNSILGTATRIEFADCPFWFDSTITQIVVPLNVSPSDSLHKRKVNTIVRASVVYSRACPQSLDFIDSTSSLSHLVCHLFPQYSIESSGCLISPKIVIFEVECVNTILRKMYAQDVFSPQPQQVCLQDALEGGVRPFAVLVRKIISLLYFEYTVSGVSVFVRGSVAVSPFHPSNCTVLPWPTDSAKDILTLAATRIQSFCRKILAIVALRRLRSLVNHPVLVSSDDHLVPETSREPLDSEITGQNTSLEDHLLPLQYIESSRQEVISPEPQLEFHVNRVIRGTELIFRGEFSQLDHGMSLTITATVAETSPNLEANIFLSEGIVEYLFWALDPAIDLCVWSEGEEDPESALWLAIEADSTIQARIIREAVNSVDDIFLSREKKIFTLSHSLGGFVLL